MRRIILAVAFAMLPWAAVADGLQSPPPIPATPTQSVIPNASAVSCPTTGASGNLTSMSLPTAGTWVVWGNEYQTFSGAAPTRIIGGISQTTGTLPNPEFRADLSSTGFSQAGYGFDVPQQIITVGGATTVYLVASATYSSTCVMSGGLYAIRVQ